MNYREMTATGDRLSVLGYGCMRFPRKGAGIDEERTRRQVLAAIEQGVNYFDTAYMYPGSEKVLGKILAGGLREQVKIATKLPHMMVKNRDDMETIFQKQLAHLQTDYIDYYLVHNVSSFADWQRLKDMGFVEFIKEMRGQGRILHEENEVIVRPGSVNSIRIENMIPMSQESFYGLSISCLYEFIERGREAMNLGYPLPVSEAAICDLPKLLQLFFVSMQLTRNTHDVTHILRVLLLTLIYRNNSKDPLTQSDSDILTYCLYNGVKTLAFQAKPLG